MVSPVSFLLTCQPRKIAYDHPTALSLKKIYWQGSRPLRDRRQTHAHGRHRPPVGLRRDPCRADSGEGQDPTAISNFWFDKLKGLIPNHFTGDKVEDVVPADELPLVEGRAVVAKRLKPVAVEAIVRGYIVGSGWKEYQKSGTVCGIQLPAGLKEAAKLPQPIFTPRPRPR